MKLVPIFDVTKHTLLAVQFDGEEDDEFRKAFINWNDTKYLYDFFKENETDLLHGYYEFSSIDEAVLTTLDLAEKLEDLIFDKSDENATEISNTLQSIFKPLDNNETTIYNLQKSKLSKSWLRIYAIRIAEQVYVITGSAIKLVLKMDTELLKLELQKLERTKNYLLENDLIEENSFEFLELNK